MLSRPKKVIDMTKKLTNGTYTHAYDGSAFRHSIVTHALYIRLP
jgi:hypothetical protein